MTSTVKRDYSLIGRDSELAQERGLVAAEWYHTDVPRQRMKALMRRRDGPAIRDTVIWLILLVLTGFGGYWFWDSWKCVPFFLCYGVLYGWSRTHAGTRPAMGPHSGPHGVTTPSTSWRHS